MAAVAFAETTLCSQTAGHIFLVAVFLTDAVSKRVDDANLSGLSDPFIFCGIYRVHFGNGFLFGQRESVQFSEFHGCADQLLPDGSNRISCDIYILHPRCFQGRI